MSAYQGRREFRLGPGFVIFYVLLTALFAAGTWLAWRDRGWSWVSLTLGGMTLLSAGAIVESLVMRIRLTDDTLFVTDLRGTRTYAKADIEEVGEAKGVPTSIRMRGGAWVRLPSVGSSLGNSLRAWRKHA